MSEQNIIDLLKGDKESNTLEGKLWTVSCEMDDVSYKLETARSICSLIANNYSSDLNDESGALWAANDIIETQANLIDEINAKVLEVRRELMELNKPHAEKKGKKK